MTRARAKQTPVRAALVDSSTLQETVRDGIGALKPSDREYLAVDIRAAFADSLDIDTPLRGDFSKVERWDYLLGHRASGQVIAFEPHSAKEDQVSKVIAKKEQARQQLAGHVRPGARIVKWLWVASGNVSFIDIEKTRRRLDDNGIEFAGRAMMARHLPGAGDTENRPKNRRRR